MGGYNIMKKSILVLFLFTFTFTLGCANISLSSSPEGYVVSEQNYTWDEAQSYCQNIGDGWNLVTINDVAENSRVANMSDTFYWIGLRDINNDNVYSDDEWVGGTSSFRNWQVGQPNYVGSCVFTNPNNHPSSPFWADNHCNGDERFSAVCEYFLGSDTDGDGILDEEDNCELTFNPSQGDLDEDGVGDWCDNCILEPNENQLDKNENYIGDACENCFYFWKKKCVHPVPINPNSTILPIKL
jgi:hypothetical protein